MLYSAFISYSHRDRAWAGWIHRELERYRIPKALIGRDSPVGVLEHKLPPVFQDREELAASSDLAHSVKEALREAANLIVICSTSGARSRWVNEEVRTFAALGRAERIQYLIVPEADADGTPLPSSEIIPPAALDLGAEPLAADARRSGDGKRSAFLKLVAGLIGVRYDDLRQREHARRQKRLLALASAASIGFVTMSGLAGFALVSRAEAVRERDVARQKSITAERTTEFVKGLFQVSDPSEAKGEEITAREVLERGIQQIEGALSAEPDVKAELVSTLSEVYIGLGSYRRADELIRRSLSIPVRNPETRARQLLVLAGSMTLQGEYASAIAIYDQALAQLPRPERLRNVSLYSGALVGRAEALASVDRYAEAKQTLGRALRWDIAREGRGGTSVARDLETAGLVHQFESDLEAARRFYEKALAIRLKTQGRFHPKVSENFNAIGAISYLQGDADSAERYWRQAIALDERVLGPDHPDVAATMNNLARLMVEQRRFRDALPLLERSVRIYETQRGDTHDDLAFILSNLALSKKGTGATAEAEALFKRALRSAEVHKHRARAPILADLADLKCRDGASGEGLRLLDQAAPIMKQDYPDDAWRTAWVENTRGACLLGIDRSSAERLIRESARPILDRWEAGTLYGSETRLRLRQL